MQHLHKTRGAGSSLVFQCSNAFQRVSSTYLLSFHILAHSFGTAQNSTLLFSDDSALFAKKHPGCGSALATLSLLGRSLRTGLGVSSNASPFNLQLSTVNPPLGHFFHESRNTDHEPRAICRIHYLSRRRASDVLLEQGIRFAKLFAGHSSVVSEYVYYVGGCDG